MRAAPIGSDAPPSAPSSDDLRVGRLRAFLRPMFVIAIGFVVSYVAFAVWLRSAAFAITVFAILQYMACIRWSLRILDEGDVERSARVTGVSLLVMIGIGAPCLTFASTALVLIPLAGVAVVLPYVPPASLRRYMVGALGVTLWVVVAGEVLPPFFARPPEPIADAIVLAGAAASIALTLRMLWTDSVQLRTSLVEARAAADAAAAAVAVRDDFLSVASHELRTPLSALRLQVELLARKSDDEARTAAVERQTSRLVKLVDELLDVSRLSQGRLTLSPEPTSLAACAREVVGTLAGPLTKAGCEVTLRLDEEARGTWDRVRVEQVVTNLVENALKYGAGRPVDVEVGVQGEHAVLRVRDRGIGMKPEEAARVFRKFERAASARHYGGLGLGLWIAARIVDAHGGRIDVETAPGAGATFTVRLPRRSSLQQEIRSAERTGERTIG